MNPASRIYIAGHRGLGGSPILPNQEFFFETERPEYVFLAGFSPFSPLDPPALTPRVCEGAGWYEGN